MIDSELEIEVHKIGIYPISKYYIDELEMMDTFSQYLPSIKGEPLLAECLCILIQNIVVSPKPLYSIQDWLKSYADGQGEFGAEVAKYTDDRLGEALDALYEAERHNIMTEISCKAIVVHEIETNKVHNDTTTVTVQGSYSEQSEFGVQLQRGYNKDNLPNCKQIVFGLNTVEDGHVPIHLHLYDGNTTDDQTHIVNWNELRTFLGKTDFCYIADSKVSTNANMEHIASNGGCFVSILPKTRKESIEFKTLLLSDKINWKDLTKRLNKEKEEVIYKYFEDEKLSKTREGFRLIWVHSSAKAAMEKKQREEQIAKIDEKLKQMISKLNKYKLKTREQIQKAIEKVTKGFEVFFNINLIEDKTLVTKKVGRGKPTATSQYMTEEKISYRLEYSILEDSIIEYEKQDGIFPLVTNTDKIEWTPLKVFETYKEQPFIEKRFSTLKSVLSVMPIFLKKPKRIEAMLLLYFFALMIVSLIERRIRKSMKEQEVESLAILPQKMKTKTPTINNLRYFFRDTIMLVVKTMTNGRDRSNIIIKGISKVHKLVLDLLYVPISAYEINSLQWWKFSST